MRLTVKVNMDAVGPDQVSLDQGYSAAPVKVCSLDTRVVSPVRPVDVPGSNVENPQLCNYMITEERTMKGGG